MTSASFSAASSAVDDGWTITVVEPSREVIVSNGVATHLALDSNAREMRSYQGLYTSMHESLDDLLFSVDGRVLDPAEAEKAAVTPWTLTRHHEKGLREVLFLPDGRPVLLARLEVDPTSDSPRAWSLTPRVDMRWIWKVPRPRYETRVEDGALLIRRQNWQPGPGALPWLAIRPSTRWEWEADPRDLTLTHPRDAARDAMARTHPHEPGHLRGSFDAERPLDVACALGATAEEALALARRALDERDSWLRSKRERIVALAATPALETGDARLDRAYRWARASMDVLVTRARGAGIYAGFHWFTNYWGRDTFICLPGANLVTGQLDTARDILQSFLRFQEVDRASSRLGRLPNIVQPGQLQYAGVDGTWWYVRAAHRYVQARRERGEPDVSYERDLTAALDLMIDGAERMAVDEHGLLRHGDGETWMDAGGEAHPYSPRGDRAVEVQALYYNGLRVAAWLAQEQGRSEKASRYADLAERTRRSFRELFWSEPEQRLFDHLNVDGSPDRQIRPNTILALTAVEPAWPPLLDEDQVRAVVDRAYERLVLPYGVTSLDPSDPAFHPRHLALDEYYYDEAYHNGDVWYWLSGPMITALCRVGRVEEARAMLDPLVDEVLDHGAVGAIREIRDGGDTGETEEFGGATFQAWSMAEMIRAMHEDLGPALGWTD